MLQKKVSNSSNRGFFEMVRGESNKGVPAVETTQDNYEESVKKLGDELNKVGW